MLEDARSSVVVTQHRFLRHLPASGIPTVCLDADWEAIARKDQGDAVPPTTAGDLFCVLYTSGSTGRPRGVMITHCAVSNVMSWMMTAFPMSGADAVLQNTPFTFVGSLQLLYAPLLMGARLVMARPEGHRDSRYLIETIRAERISHVKVVPSMLHAMLEDPGTEAFTSLRCVFCGGEVLLPSLLKQFHAHLNAELVNVYGPTEVTIRMFWASGRQGALDVAPIGRPIANSQLYILDGHMQPVPIGVPGELYIGGVGLARGYLGRPSLTAERFVPNPFSAEGGARLYRTGDLARYLPDGNLEYLGRTDHQVKLRGFRIELGEIEAMLSEHPGVRETVVVAREHESGDKRLVAYIVPRSGGTLTVDSLRRFVQRTLPEYMAPAVFILLASLPRTPHGKVDRGSLPAPDPARPGGESVAPRTPMERQLVPLWEEILGVHPVGVTDNFFELGGHSLLAGRLLARVRAHFQTDVSLRAFFAAPTVAEMATTIEDRLADSAESGAIARALKEIPEFSDQDVRPAMGEGGSTI